MPTEQHTLTWQIGGYHIRVRCAYAAGFWTLTALGKQADIAETGAHFSGTAARLKMLVEKRIAERNRARPW